MRKNMRFFLILSVLLFVLWPLFSFSDTITTTPTTVNVSTNNSYTTTITYTLSSSSSSTLNSPKGRFITSTGRVLGYVNRSLTIIPQQSSIGITGASTYSGKVSETLNIPFYIIQNALNSNVNTFTYKRDFYVSGDYITSASVTIRIVNPAAMPLTINRVSLYFKNKKAEITIKKNKRLYAFVDIYFSGSGLLKGYWEVDGHILAPRIFKYLTHGTKVTLKTPDTSQIDTFKIGTHFIRFVITSPEPSFEMPKAIYFVSDTPLKETSLIKLISPKNGSYVKIRKGQPLQFIWEGKDKAYFYLLEFFKKGEEKPVFSAYTKSSTYSMPFYIGHQYFSRGSYKWHVKGFDEDSRTVAESDFSVFTIK
ncbi:hypothetical protein [Hippea maritima]|uniref:Uncharacterized protein n=1 Tax=Hippea maritima (strain ATCC 700847 / DSM 10411 / MH2) TaxID=760142 RepID=F2LWI1_HIPMA|nr:hypothetical protein [Hippea maritima]AEA34090.1 hypothetical protein Hipma_1124 [Hippea maritima DSM 10411]